jgi:hypothetical protein
MVVNLTKAALHLGYRSRSTLQRLVRDGQLAAYRVSSSGRDILLETDPPGLPSLREAVQALTQFRPRSPLWQQPRPRLPAADLADDAALDAEMTEIDAGLDSSGWTAMAEQLNAYLGDSWPAPPWSAEQVNTLFMCAALVLDATSDD